MRIGVVARLDVDEAVELAGKIVDLLLERGVETFMDTPLLKKLNKITGNNGKKYENLACGLAEIGRAHV